MDPIQAADHARRFGGAAVIKALVPAGRRGKAGAVRLVDGPAEAQSATVDLIGRTVADHVVDTVYVEERVAIDHELYVSFAFSSITPKVIVSKAGGVDIEQTYKVAPQTVAEASIDPRRGLTSWDAIDLWRRAGLAGSALPVVAQVTAKLYAAFRDADALMLEVNPLALDKSGKPHVVGAMMEIDDNALFRHAGWREEARASGRADRPLSERERRVIEADRTFPGGAVRYTELDGDIGLFVAGGGAGLLQHDMVVDLGGRPANHTDVSPTPTLDKPKAVFDAILTNPRTRGLLIGYNYLQMAPCDRVIEALLEIVREREIDTTRFPIVIRLFGPEEERARALAAELPGVQYLPSGSPLVDGVRSILKAVEEASAREAAQ